MIAKLLYSGELLCEMSPDKCAITTPKVADLLQPTIFNIMNHYVQKRTFWHVRPAKTLHYENTPIQIHWEFYH